MYRAGKKLKTAKRPFRVRRNRLQVAAESQRWQGNTAGLRSIEEESSEVSAYPRGQVYSSSSEGRTRRREQQHDTR